VASSLLLPFFLCHIDFKFTWSLVNGATNKQLTTATTNALILMLSSLVVVLVSFVVLSIMTTSLLCSMPTDISKPKLGDTERCDFWSECLAGIEPAPVSPEGQRPRNLNFNFLNLPFIYSQNEINSPLAQPAKNEKRAPLIASRVDFFVGCPCHNVCDFQLV
jgi:hypothetical protein